MDKVVFTITDLDIMDIWFGNPEDEAVCEEAGEGIILKKDKNGKTIGIEKLHVREMVDSDAPSPVEVVVA